MNGCMGRDTGKYYMNKQKVIEQACCLLKKTDKTVSQTTHTSRYMHVDGEASGYHENSYLRLTLFLAGVER